MKLDLDVCTRIQYIIHRITGQKFRTTFGTTFIDGFILPKDTHKINF